MIISRQHGYLFIEVPNTASTALAGELTRFYGGERFLHKHATLPEFLKTAEARAKRYFIFATVRHPLDAALTQYFKMRSNHRGRFTMTKLRGTASVTPRHLALFEYVQNGGDFPGFLQRLQRGVYNNYYLMLAEQMNVVMRYERLDEDFAQVLTAVGLEQVRPIPRVNATAGKASHYWDYYPEALQEHAIAHYLPFMRRWGYDFPPEWKVPRSQLKAELTFLANRRMIETIARVAGVGPNSGSHWMVTARDIIREVWC